MSNKDRSLGYRLAHATAAWFKDYPTAKNATEALNVATSLPDEYGVIVLVEMWESPKGPKLMKASPRWTHVARHYARHIPEELHAQYLR